MVHIGAWWVFTIDGEPHLFERKRTSWPDKFTGRKVLIGYDWIPRGDVNRIETDCECIADIRREVNEHLVGLT